MSENENTSDQDDVSFIRTDDMVCLQCSETGERVCLAAEGFGNRHCFLEPIANRNYPPEMPSCVFVIEQALSVRALQEMVTAESGDQARAPSAKAAPSSKSGLEQAATDEDGQPVGLSEAPEQGAGGSAGGAPAPGLSSVESGSGSGVGGGNRTLLYGHAVLLRHYHSGMHLATLPLCSSRDKLAFDVGLKDSGEVGESCWWTVHPGSKQRSEGEKVRVGDDLILVSVATERYLHCTTTGVEGADGSPPPMSSATATAMSQTHNYPVSKHAIVNASFHSTHWSIVPFGTGLSRIKSVGYVFGGQVLRLLHGGDECLTVSASTATSTTAQLASGSDPQAQAQASIQQQTAQQLNPAASSSSESQMGSSAPGHAHRRVPTVDVVYEGGAVMSQARSLWRLDFIRTKWSGGFVQYSNALRIRHITTGKYLGVYDDHLCLIPKIEATVERTAFCLRLTKDDSKASRTGESGDDKDEEVIGVPAIKYGDTSFFVQHVESQRWLSYRSYETKRRGIGRVEEKQAILSAEGKMDDCLEFSRSQEEEAKTARVIRKCDALFSKFIKILDHIQCVASGDRSAFGHNQSGALLLEATSALMDGHTSGAASGMMQQTGDAPQMDSRQLAKKRASIAASSAAAVAAAAMSGMAPLLLSAGSLDGTPGAAHDAQHSPTLSGSATATSGHSTTPALALRGAARRLSGLVGPQGVPADQLQAPASLFPHQSQLEMSKCLEDLIMYFAPPEEGCEHEQEQKILRALRNRQDLFQEEGILNLILDAIDKINLISGRGLLVLLIGDDSSALWDNITAHFYQLLAAIIKDNHTNCAQFAQSHRLNWLFSRLSSQQASSEGTGMLDVLHYVLVDSPEALNMLKESHIRVLISLLERHGRDPKVLNVLCSLCVSNGVAIRSSQNSITNHLLAGRNLLLQTRQVDHVASMQPNIYVARVDGSAMYTRWYYELVIDHIELINNLSPHLRVGWANTRGFRPHPGSGSNWGANGAGDDCYSYAFDGQYLWTCGRPTLVRIPPASTVSRFEQVPLDYQAKQSLLEAYANQQNEMVSSPQQQQQANNQTSQTQTQGDATLGEYSSSNFGQQSDGLTSLANIDAFAHSPYLRVQKNDVIGCLIDLSVPAIQFTINGKQIFGLFKNFNVIQGGFFHPVVSFSAKVSCRFLFGSNQGELRYRPPQSFSPLVDVLLPNQEVQVEPCFSFGDLAKQVLSGPQLAPDCLPQTVADLVYIPRVLDVSQLELAGSVAYLREYLAENAHELWAMSRIESGWIYGAELDEHNRIHPYIEPFSLLPMTAKSYKLDSAAHTLKTILALGYRIVAPQSSSSSSQGANLSPTSGSASSTHHKSPLTATQLRQQNHIKTYRLPNLPYMQSNGYKPAPLDLNNIDLSAPMSTLVELLAEHMHNLWSLEKIQLRWSYKRRDPYDELSNELAYSAEGRSCHLLPYKFVDQDIKDKNRQAALETVLTIIAYGYHIELSPTGLDATTTTGGLAGVTSGSNPTPTPTETGETPSESQVGDQSQQQIDQQQQQQQQIQLQQQQPNGHEVLLANAMEVGMRHYRAEQNYAVHSGRWYYEVEIQSLGPIQVGWANLNFGSGCAFLGCDQNAWAFECNGGRKVHNSAYEPFGKVTSIGDVVGCMLDLNDMTISFSLNGKLLLDFIGNEMAFSSIEMSSGFVPAISLGAAQRSRLIFGQDVEQLRYFTDYGLQEGYQPFCVNMHKPMSLWYNRREPNFTSIDDSTSQACQLEVTRIAGGTDSPPALKIAYKQFESQERANWEYVRLSLPVTVNAELCDETDKLAKMQEIQAHQLRLAYSTGRRISQDINQGNQRLNEVGRSILRPQGDPNNQGSATGAGLGGQQGSARQSARLEQHMLQSGFSMSDVKGLQRSYNEAPGVSFATSSSHVNPSGAAAYGGGLSGEISRLSNLDMNSQTGRSTSQRKQFVKMRSVDDNQQQLSVPSFSQAQRMMTGEQQASSRGSTGLLKRRNTGFQLRKSQNSTSMDNLDQQHQKQQQAQRVSSSSRFKSIFGSIKSRPANDATATATSRGSRSQSSERSQQLSVPKINILTNADGSQSQLARSRSMSRSTDSVSRLEGGHQESPSLGRSLVRRLSRVGGFGSSSSNQAFAQQQHHQPHHQQAQHHNLSPSSSLHQSSASHLNGDDYSMGAQFDLAQLEPATLELIDEYYYGVRIFPGQEPSHVLCGWLTSLYRHDSLPSLQDIQRTQVIQSTSLITGQPEICERRECYLLNAGMLYKEMYPSPGVVNTSNSNPQAGTPTQSSQQQDVQEVQGSSGASTASSRSNRGMLIGCHIDTGTGVLSFTVDGRPTRYKFYLEPQTKLYPGCFFQATTGDCLQFELIRTPQTLPLSSAILSLTAKHVQPQCPPRLKVQTLQSSQWSRVPNVTLRPNALKLSDMRGWSMLANEPLAMICVYIPEDDRCLDVLELIEHEKLLRFHSNTLKLYGALCAQGNHRVAHTICSHVDQRQLLYAINCDYLSGELRQGFADLLISLHLEFHAYGRHLTQNEFIVPITKELCQLYASDEPSVAAGSGNSGSQAATSGANCSLTHSFSRIECVSIRTDMQMSPCGFDLNSMIEQHHLQRQSQTSSEAINYAKILSSPYFPIDVLKRLVFRGLDEAVFKGNLPIRDQPGGSNASLFVPLLKLADKLLLVGCLSNQELAWLLNLIDPELFVRPREANVSQLDSLAPDPSSKAGHPGVTSMAGLSFLAPGSNLPSSVWRATIIEQARIHERNQERRGLLQMPKLDEQVKLAICHLLHHLLDIQLRHRIESIMAFGVNFVGQLQCDQRRRYNEIKNSDLPSHLTAKKTREFRSSPREQMRYILNFKNSDSSYPNDDLAATSDDAINSSPSSEYLQTNLKSLHFAMMKQIKTIIETENLMISSSSFNPSKLYHLQNPGADLDAELQRSSFGSSSLDHYEPFESQSDQSGASLFGGLGKLLGLIKLVKDNLANPHGSNQRGHQQRSQSKASGMLACSATTQRELKFVKDIVKTMVKWADEWTIENKQLIRQMFHLLLRCYNGVGELIEALDNSYVVGEKSKHDVIELLQVLSKVRALLAVRMGPEEEEVMRDCLWTLVNNVVFFQHPDLIRILRVHENVMHVMMNTLSKRSSDEGSSQSQQQQQQDSNQQQLQNPSSAARSRAQSLGNLQLPGGAGSGTTGAPGEQLGNEQSQQEADISKMVVSCCRFLCFFCRSSAKNQKAMFEHLGFILEHSNILLSRPSLRGSTPLDVAYSSLMENHELVLALRESYLEKIAVYLSRCGLQSNQELVDKGYPDVGWDPVEGERYLDFLRFCVWVNGESVEENSNLVIRLLIRRPECLGPALRGEGQGLFAAIKDAIGMAEMIHAEQIESKRCQILEGSSDDRRRHQSGTSGADPEGADASGEGEDDADDEINIGAAILNFYCALVDLLGRCAPDLATVGQGKHESIRARSILRSLVPLQDLKSAIALRFALVNPQWAQMVSGEQQMPFAEAASSFMPNHKQSLVLFLERVYGIDDQQTFFALLEDAFLPDMRAATMLERPSSSMAADSTGARDSNRMDSSSQLLVESESSSQDDSENEMTLALNRYLGSSAIPLLIRESHYFKNAENYANLLEPTLHTAYRLSKVKILTKGQRESVSDFLIALTREMQPNQLLKLLRKLTVDVSVLNESTTVALRLLTLHYERCSKYYGYTAQASSSGAAPSGASAGNASSTSGTSGTGSVGANAATASPSSPVAGAPAAGSGVASSGGGAASGASAPAGTATEEERRLTMVLFTNIFDSLSLMDYDPELFENALPCLNALACALPPDYSLTESRDFVRPLPGAKLGAKAGQQATSTTAAGASTTSGGVGSSVSARQQLMQQQAAASLEPYAPQPVDTHGVQLNADLKQISRRFSEHYHDAWAARKLDRDWQYGETYSYKSKTHPRLRPYCLLTQFERDRYIEPIEEAIKALIAMGWRIERAPDGHPTPSAGGGATPSPEPMSSGARNLQQGSGRGVTIASSSDSMQLIREYNPQPVDTSNLSLTRELQALAERSAENAHDLWAKKTMHEWTLRLRASAGDILRAPIMLHPLMVPYDLLTDREKRKNRDRSQELLKFMLFEGYRVSRPSDTQLGAPATGPSRPRMSSRAGLGLDEAATRTPVVDNTRRFAYSILDKLISYTDIVMVKLELLKPSANFSRRSSFKQSDRDVKFFSKVVLPLIERYFSAHREFFTTCVTTSNNPQTTAAATAAGDESGSSAPVAQAPQASSEQQQQLDQLGAGSATLREREMLVNLFCKLASILRNKLSVIGPDARIFVRCLQVLTRAIDAKTICEQSIDFVRSSLLTFFNKTAQDLSQCVYNLTTKRYNSVRGTTMRTSSSLNHIHLSVLPTLTSLFDHLASSESGKYLLLDEIQIACQKILVNLYLLGTRIQLAGNHSYSRKELERHRHSYGNCLAALGAAFPLAFLEPELGRFNRFASFHTKRHQPLGGAKAPKPGRRPSKASAAQAQQQQQQQPEVAAAAIELASQLPRLDDLLKLIHKFVQSNGQIYGNATQASNSMVVTGLPVVAPVTSSQSAASDTLTSTPSGPIGLNGSQSTSSSATNSQLAKSAISASMPTSSSADQKDHQGSAPTSPGAAGVSQHQSTSGSGSGPAHKRSTAGSHQQVSSIAPADNDSSIIEVIVPMLCAYLPFWFSQSQEASAATRQLGAGSGSTKVGSQHLGTLLRDIMNLIGGQVGVDEGPASQWLVSIAAHASQIIVDSPGLDSGGSGSDQAHANSSTSGNSLLKDSFLPLSSKLAARAEQIYHREETMRGYLKSASSEDTTAIEEKIQEKYHILVRDIYAFYPLLIKYVDFKRSQWLKHKSQQVQNSGITQQHSNNNNPSNEQLDASEWSLEHQQSRPEQLLFHQVATVFDIWSQSQYFRREEQNFISQHEIDNMALIMQASNRPGRIFFQKTDASSSKSASGARKKSKRRGQGERRDREREIASSLLVVALKRLLPIGMNLFNGRERELVQHAKERFLKKESTSRVEDIVRWQLTQPNKMDPCDEFCWQHYLYSRLGAQSSGSARPLDGSTGSQECANDHSLAALDSSMGDSNNRHHQLSVDSRIVARIVDMARVFHGLHIIDHPNLQRTAGKRSCVSTQRRRVVIACFRMTSLHSLPRHRAINIFLRSYCDTWLLDENFGQEKLIEDLTQTFEQAEMKQNSPNGQLLANTDPLGQLIMTLSRQATTERHGQAMSSQAMSSGGGDTERLYLQFADIFRASCGGDEDDEDEDGDEGADDEAGCDADSADDLGKDGEDAYGGDDGDSGLGSDSSSASSSSGGTGSGSSIHEQEMEKQRLLFQQSRLSVRGVAEMILLYISSFSRSSAGAIASAGSGGGAGADTPASAGGLSQTPMILSTLKLGISILRGGNVDVQRRMLKHLKDKKDVGFFQSVQLLMNSCSVLNLDAFERNQKAEALGVRSEATGSSGSSCQDQSMYDAEFTCKLFRFFQLLCEGHNLEFQNYLRTQVGNTSTVNVVISTVDYLLRLQESIMDFYWHYSSKDIIDSSGTESFIKAFKIAKQVFSTLTESVQGPCPQNQQALAHSRLWHAVGGFLFLFAHMQDKLSRNSSQLGLLIELLDLQKEMVIMMLSMLEGSVVNGTIGKQMVETLVESSANVEIILKFFDMFLKLPRLTQTANFQEYDKTSSGWISPVDLRKAMEQHKIYRPEEIDYLLSCCEPNHDGMIDYREFIERFHQPARDIGFNLAVLLTNLAEHITNEPRLQRFLETASAVLKYFEPYLGRIEIMGSSKRIERVYFEIKESTLDQWAKPQIQESKRAFFYSVVTEGDDKEKLEAFVNFCEDTIFEMQHATKILGEIEEERPTRADKYPFDASASGSGGSAGGSGGSASSSGGQGGAGSGDSAGRRGASGSDHHSTPSKVSKVDLERKSTYLGLIFGSFFMLYSLVITLLGQLRPSTIRRRWYRVRALGWRQLIWRFIKNSTQFSFKVIRFVLVDCLMSLLKLVFGIMVDSEGFTMAGSNHLGLTDEEKPDWPPKTKSANKVNYASETQVDDGPVDWLDSSLVSTSTQKKKTSDGNIHDTNKTTTTTTTSGDVSLITELEHDPEALDAGGGITKVVASDEETLLNQLGLIDEPSARLAQQTRTKRKGLGAKLSQLANYKEKIVSFLARNFYTIKLLALVTAFIINFILLFFRVTIWSAELDQPLPRPISSPVSLIEAISSANTLSSRPSNSNDEDGQANPLASSGQLDLIESKLELSILAHKRRFGLQDEDDDDGDEDGGEIVSDATDGAGKNGDEDEDVVGTGNDDNEEEDDDDNDFVDTQGGAEKAAKQTTADGNDKDDGDDDDDVEDNSTELVEFVVMDERYYYMQSILTVLASVHSLFSICMLIAYYHLKVPLVIFKREKEIARKLEFDGMYIVEQQDEASDDSSWTGSLQERWDKLVISADSFPVNYWDKFVKKRVREKYREQYGYEQVSKLLGMNKHRGGSGAEYASRQASLLNFAALIRHLSRMVKVDFRYQLWKAGITLTDQSFLYQLFYLIFSLAGHYNYFFFAAHLLDVAFGFKKLRTILHSVTHNGQQLVLTVMLLTIVVYIYTVIAFNFFRKFYIQGEDEEEITEADRKCHSMMSCFVYHFYQGVRAGGGIGDVIEAPDGDDYEFFRIAFDISFFFSVIVILLAIIQGLIIDAFGELRGQLLAVAEDMESNCFICGIGKDVLDKSPRGFEQHVQKEHNLANYMFFLMHLINKPNTDYTGQETYVWELYQSRCWNFFPVGECFRTQSEEEAERNQAS